MFGQKDDKADNQDANNGATDPMQAVSEGADLLLSTEPNSSSPNAGPPPVASAATTPPTDTAWQHPGAPLDSNNDGPSDQIRDVISPAGGYPSSPNDRITPGGEPEKDPEPAIAFTPDTPQDDSGLVSSDDVDDAELIDIKKKALSELIPLIDKLDMPPQEKFRTIMMMIQASDDPRLVEKAYESAHSIEDEEVRAQALLDIVNEINYFTQPAPAETETAA